MPTPDAVARQLAGHLTNGPWTSAARAERAIEVLGGAPLWLAALLERLTRTFPSTSRPTRQRVTEFFRGDAAFLRACTNPKRRLKIVFPTATAPAMYPATGPPQSWPVPALVTPHELAEWLGVSTSRVDWFAERQDRVRQWPPGPRHHYHYRWLAKRVGGSARLIEAPKWNLKTIQRRILHGILDSIPPHPTAHGYCLRRSVLTFAAPHIGQAVVVRIDLRNFFPAIPQRRVCGLFLTVGYPGVVASLLAALCTNQAPDCVWAGFPQFGSCEDRLAHEALYSRAHLPQGAPTSPALANLAAYRLDCRLHGLATAAGAVYTRYADDLLFSGDTLFASGIRRFLPQVEAIILEEGFTPHRQKTRVMRQSQRQSAGGLILNQHVNVPRRDYDLLKATLFNCVRRGPETENREQLPDFRAHLAGRVAHLESVHPTRGQSLRQLFLQIRWSREMPGV